jgi:hypothetical protein
VEPATTACRRSSERTTGKWVGHNAAHSRRMLVGGFRVTWDILFASIYAVVDTKLLYVALTNFTQVTFKFHNLSVLDSRNNCRWCSSVLLRRVDFDCVLTFRRNIVLPSSAPKNIVPPLSALKKPSETLANSQNVTRYNNPEYHHLYSHRRENLVTSSTLSVSVLLRHVWLFH